jgi:hypothetical protein
METNVSAMKNNLVRSEGPRVYKCDHPGRKHGNPSLKEVSPMLKRLFLIIAVLGILSFARADSSFDGKWTAEVVRPAPAAKQNLAITFNTSEGKVSGSMVIDSAGEVPLDWGMVKGDLITFKVKMPFNNTMTTFVYLGRIEGDQISFGRRPEDLTMGRLVEFTAKRTK